MARKVIERNISFDDVKQKYYVNFDYGKNEAGERIKKTKTFETHKDAKRALTLFEADKHRGAIVKPVENTIEDWLNYWIEHVKSPKCEETTLYGYKSIINKHILPELGKMPIQKVNVHNIQMYLSKMHTKGLSSNTIRKHYDLLKDAFNKAVSEEILLKNPLLKVEPPKIESTEMGFYTSKQLQSLFLFSEGTTMEIAIKLAGYLGLRRGEICGLKWKSVNWEKKKLDIMLTRTQAGKSIVIKDTKNKASERTLSIPDDLLEALKRVKESQEQNKNLLNGVYQDLGYIFTRADGKPYRPNYLSDKFKNILKANSLPHIRLHDLRHSFASIANELGIPIFNIGKILGHSQTSTTTKIYTHLFDKTHSEEIDIVANSINEKN